MPELLDFASADERRELARLRAEQWRGALTVTNFGDRNERLYAHPYGRDRVETWVLREGDGGDVLTSMDVLTIGLLVKRNGGPPEHVPGILIASVITAPALRGKGYSSRLLSDYFGRRPEVSGILYSDIGAPFYSRFGFFESPMRCAEVATSGVAARTTPPQPISLESFVARVCRARAERVAIAPSSDAVALYPDSLWLDWQVDRYRFFAQTRAKSLGDIFFEVDHPGGRHLIGALPDYISGRLDGFWVDANCEACLMTLHRIAAKHEMPAIRFWAPAESKWPGKIECPMVRVAGAAREPAFVDSQFCDWW